MRPSCRICPLWPIHPRVTIGVAQEYPNVDSSSERQVSNGIPWFSFYKAHLFYKAHWRVTCSTSTCVWDADYRSGARAPRPTPTVARATVR